MEEYLHSTAIIDWTHRAVLAQAKRLAVPGNSSETVRACFEFVRDAIRHSGDSESDTRTCKASDVLYHGTGWCYAKSHLLAALLRANGIPAGLCYQRLALDDSGAHFSLHGYNAVYLPQHGWYRVDARGNKPGVEASFDPPTEHLAFSVQSAGEFDFENICSEPLACVIDVLRQHGWKNVLAHLPDAVPENFGLWGLEVRKA